ncbi:hypothetical protein [Bradyrhizobium genosp. P]|uniref:hypothetical protein n=1 Tax=Bradyrhizobium genosp. P TaxID=83641 RepID=UPI003CF31650
MSERTLAIRPRARRFLDGAGRINQISRARLLLAARLLAAAVFSRAVKIAAAFL